ncbi:TrmB family transcriptional regulator [Haladaptatus sp. DFWS20]|uniref:TrmB family transcriptional regulator n=1 Tax=Haladaptatus sp. DFWS20 TaxID=3403467 RepID=UPI003EB9ED51
MGAHEAVRALQKLGLSSYESQVFVALQQLGTGTAQDVSEVSNVPRSQVYGAADDLANRGLLEVVESSPKAFRSVSLSAAREQLSARIEHEQERAFENLEAIENEQASYADEETVSTLRGHQPIRERMIDLIASANEQAVLVGATGELLTDDIIGVLSNRATSGVLVMIVTRDRAVQEHFENTPVNVIVVPETHHGGFTGRTLLVDDATVLLSVPTEDDHPEPFDEVALWTAGTSIGHILTRFIHAGMESGLDNYPSDSSEMGKI